MAQIRLAFSRNDSTATSLSRIAYRMLSIKSGKSSANLTDKLSRLGVLNPAALAVVDRLTDHLLRYEEDR